MYVGRPNLSDRGDIKFSGLYYCNGFCIMGSAAPVEHETTVKISSDLYAEPTLLILFKLIAVIIKSQSTGFTADTSAAPTR